MAWTAPMTAVSGVIWTAAQFNANIRDNLIETMPGKATAASNIYTSTGSNAIAERHPSTATVATSQSTSSTSYVNLTTTGPTVTVNTGTHALVWVAANMSHSVSNGECSAAVAVSGATTINASDDWRLMQSGVASANANRFAVAHLFTTLPSGSNTFTVKYRTNTGTATFQDRDIVVLPL